MSGGNMSMPQPLRVPGAFHVDPATQQAYLLRDHHRRRLEELQRLAPAGPYGPPGAQRVLIPVPVAVPAAHPMEPEEAEVGYAPLPGPPGPSGLHGLGEVLPRATGNMYDPTRKSWPIFPQTDVPALIRGPDGSVYLNPAKDAQKWFYARALGQGDVFANVVAANATAQVVLQAPPEENLRGDFEVVKWMSTQTGRFAVSFVQPNLDRTFQNNPIPHTFVMGTCQLPAVWFETTMIEASTAMLLRLTDLTGLSNTIRIVGAGRRFLDYGQGLDRQAVLASYYKRRTHPFFLTFDSGTTVSQAGGAAATDYTMTVPGVADFECWQVMDDSDGAYNIEIFEGRSSRGITDGPVDATSFVASPTVTVAGFPSGGIIRSGSFPFSWTFTHTFKRGAQIRVRLTNTSGGTNVLRLCLAGRLIYYDEVPSLPSPSVQRQRSLDPVRGPYPSSSAMRRGMGPLPGYPGMPIAPSGPLRGWGGR